jgi:hypothetical protein
VKEGMSFYTLGTSGFVAVTDVVKITRDLMKSHFSNNRFTLVAQNMTFKEILSSIAKALKVKKPNREASQLLMEILWRADAILALCFGKKRQFTKATARASHSKSLYSNEKVTNALNFKFVDIHQYIEEISKLES